MINIVYNQTYINEDNQTGVWRLPLPVVPSVPALPVPWVPSLDAEWNCNRCGSDAEFYMQVLRGDVIPFQLRLPDVRNINPSAPVLGWGTSAGVGYVSAKVVTCGTCEVLLQEVDQFATDYWVGYSETLGSIQTLHLDTGSIPAGVGRFRLMVELYDQNGDIIQTVFTQCYEFSNCINTVLIEGTNPVPDCLNYVYEVPQIFNGAGNPPDYIPTPFSLRFRIPADFQPSGFSSAKTENEAGRIINYERRKNYELRMPPVPPYVAEMLATATAGTSEATVDGIKYVDFTDVEKNNTYNKMFVISLTCSQVCETTQINCIL